jgi:hypothetical protein
MTADHCIPGYSQADRAVLKVRTDRQLETNKALRDLARIAVECGIEHWQSVDNPPPDKPKKRGQWHYTSVVRHAPGHVVATGADGTGRTRRFEIVKSDDGSLTAQKL